jgi:hypothetical protein
MVKELRDLGFTDLGIDEICELRNHGVKPDYVREMRELGLAALDVDELIELKNHGVKPDFIREMMDEGLLDLSVDRIVELRDDPSERRRMRRDRTESADAEVSSE